MISSIQTIVRAADSLIARAYLSLFRERNALLSFLFHSLFRQLSHPQEFDRVCLQSVQVR